MDQKPASAALPPRNAEVAQFPVRPDGDMPAQPVTPMTAAPVAAPAPAVKPKSNVRRLVLGAVVLVALGYGGSVARDYWTVGRFMVHTDDAYLKADINIVAPRVSGYISKIAVTENQKVKAGDLLMLLDDGDFQNAVSSTQSKVATQVQTVARIKAQVTAAQASVAQAEAVKLSADAGLLNAQSKNDRITRLAQSSVAAQSAQDDAAATLQQAKAAVAGSVAQIAAANANVAVLQAEEAEAQSTMASLMLDVEQAKRNLDRTLLRAPVDGVVANLAVQAGDLVQPGSRVAAVVPVDTIYVEANYKETQMAEIAPGSKVKVTIDALKGQSFEATVSSLAPATGSQFSLLPAENATGNFTKVVQRVPVRIELPEDLRKSGLLRAGLSVVVDIDSRTTPKGQ